MHSIIDGPVRPRKMQVRLLRSLQTQSLSCTVPTLPKALWLSHGATPTAVPCKERQQQVHLLSALQQLLQVQACPPASLTHGAPGPGCRASTPSECQCGLFTPVAK